jgi:O-antigen ligase
VSGIFAGAMITIMALVVFGAVIPLGGVDPVLLSPAFTLVALLAVLWAGKTLFSREATLSRPALHWAVLGFLAYAVTRYFTSPFEYEARLELFQIGLCGLVYFVAANQFHRRRDRTFFVVTLMILALFESSYGMWQAFTQSDAVFFWERPGYTGRGSGTYICPNHLAGFLEMVLGLVVARAAILRRESKSIERTVLLKVLTIYVAAMAIMGILVTLSRSGWMATLIGLFALVFLGDWRLRFSLPRLALVLAIVAFMGFVLWNVEPIRNYLIKTFPVDSKTQTVSLTDPTLGGRRLMWAGTVKMIQDYPLFGVGVGAWQWIYQRYKDFRILSEPDYPHNDYLNLAADYGLIGFAIMLALFACFFRHAWRVAKRTPSSEQRAFAVGAMISVISLLVHSWFDFNLHIPANSLLLAAIMGFTAAIEDPEPRPAENRNRLPFVRYAVGAAVLVTCGIGIRFFVPTVSAFHFTEAGESAKWDTNYEEAFAHFRRASALDARYPKPHIDTGEIYLSSARWRMLPARQTERREFAHKAIASFERALALNPTLAYVLVSKARAHQLAGEDDLALKTYQRAIEVAPFNAYAYHNLGTFYRDRGEDQKALEAFYKANLYTLGNELGFQLNEWEIRERRGTAQPK